MSNIYLHGPVLFIRSTTVHGPVCSRTSTEVFMPMWYAKPLWRKQNTEGRRYKEMAWRKTSPPPDCWLIYSVSVADWNRSQMTARHCFDRPVQATVCHARCPNCVSFLRVYSEASVWVNRICPLLHIVQISMCVEFSSNWGRINISHLIVVPGLSSCSSGVIAF